MTFVRDSGGGEGGEGEREEEEEEEEEGRRELRNQLQFLFMLEFVGIETTWNLRRARQSLLAVARD